MYNDTNHRTPNDMGWFYNAVLCVLWMVCPFFFWSQVVEPNGRHPLLPRQWLTEENNDVFAYLWSNGTTTLNYTIHCSTSKNISHFRCLAARCSQCWCWGNNPSRVKVAQGSIRSSAGRKLLCFFLGHRVRPLHPQDLIRFGPSRGGTEHVNTI